MKISITVSLACMLLSCAPSPDLQQAAKQVEEAELAFAKLAGEKGVDLAFYEYAAPEAVINRGGIIKGKDAIRKFYEPSAKEGIQLSWKPDTVIVAGSADLAYTYGKYTLIRKDSVGNSLTSSGIFHTVWRKQPDGSWKFVWD